MGMAGIPVTWQGRTGSAGRKICDIHGVPQAALGCTLAEELGSE